MTPRDRATAGAHVGGPLRRTRSTNAVLADGRATARRSPDRTRTLRADGVTPPRGPREHASRLLSRSGRRLALAATSRAPRTARQRPPRRAVAYLYRSDDLTGCCRSGSRVAGAAVRDLRLAFTAGLPRRRVPAAGSGDRRAGRPPGEATCGLPDGDRAVVAPVRPGFLHRRRDTPAPELAIAREHFFVPHRIGRSPRQHDHGDLRRLRPAVAGDDGRAGQPRDRRPARADGTVRRTTTTACCSRRRVTDPNGNRVGRRVRRAGAWWSATAVMGKPGEHVGDSLLGLRAGPRPRRCCAPSSPTRLAGRGASWARHHADGLRPLRLRRTAADPQPQPTRRVHARARDTRR